MLDVCLVSSDWFSFSNAPFFCQVLSERDAQLLLKDGKDLVIAVYDYWLNKRLRVVSTV